MGQSEHRAYVAMKKLEEKMKDRPYDNDLKDDYRESVLNHERKKHEDELEELRSIQSMKYHY